MLKLNKRIKIVDMLSHADLHEGKASTIYSQDKSSPKAVLGRDEICIKQINGFYYGEESRQGYLLTEGIEL